MRRLLPLLALLLAGPALAQGTSGLDLDAMDTTIRPQDDLFRYVNGTWLETTEIPGARPRYGSFDMLPTQSAEDVLAIIQDAA